MNIEAIKQDCIARRDWGTLFGWYGSHERLIPWREVHPLMTDAEYWENLGDVFTMIESSGPHQGEWIRYFESKRPGRELVMTAEEREELAAMPDELTLYRGYFRGGRRAGLSWSLNPKTAEEFAGRATDPRGRRAFFGLPVGQIPMVVTGRIAKRDAYAWFSRREESELVVNPRHIRGMRARRVG
ncbi:MAG: hypothetical protein JSR82_21075 [Verrucomicrobia bacterium]|nr:hypothetical protein [Verrucomicrobiota bacterium]